MAARAKTAPVVSRSSCGCGGPCACRGVDPVTPEAIVRLQRDAGNATVAMLLQRRASAAPTVQRAYSNKDVEELLTNTPQDQVPGKLIPAPKWLASISDDERKKLIGACLASESWLAGEAIANLWKYAATWESIARGDPGLWARSLHAMLKTDHFKLVLSDMFLQDTEAVARGYLDQNQEYCESTLDSMFLDRAGNPKVGPPSPEQLEARKQATDPEAAENLVALQNDLKALHSLAVARVRMHAPPAARRVGDLYDYYLDVKFDPSGPPSRKNDPNAPDQPKQTWDDVKKAYDAGVEAIREITSLHPTLYVLVRDQFEDISKTSAVATDKSPERTGAATVVGQGLAETITNITKVRPMIGKTLAKDLDPIHKQLRAGTATSGATRRNWASDPVWKPLAEAYVEANKPGPWWQTLGLAALEMGAFVIVGMATGGVGLAVAMAAKGAAEAAMAAGKADVASAAAGSNVTEDTALMTGEQAREARTEAAIAAAFALLDALQVGAEVKAASGAAKMAGTAGAEAQKAIEASHKVLQYEKKLLGTVAKEDLEQAAKEAEKLAGEASEHAKKARDAANAAGGAERSGFEARARLAEKAAERANKAKDRLKETAAGYTKAAEAAAHAVPEKELAPTITEVLPDGAGKIVVTKAGQVFHCSSPCSEVLAKFADVISRHPELKAKAGAYEKALADAEKAMSGQKGAASEATKHRIAKAAGTLAAECQNYRKAGEITKWLSGDAVGMYPALKGVKLDEAAIVRILGKGKSIDRAKGQLFEELTAVRVEQMLKSPGERAKLAGQFAGEKLEFIPGHMLRARDGRQLTDGVVGFRRPDGAFQIVTVIEAKAGVNTAVGLRLGEAELNALNSAKFNEWIKIKKAGDPSRAAQVRRMSLQEFADAHPNLVDLARQKKLKADADWEKVALETVQAEHAEALRAGGDARGAKAIEGMSTGQYKAAHPDRAERANELLPLPEAGQFTRDLERGGELGVERLDPTKLPPMVIEGPKGGPVLNPQWKSSVPKGEWSKMDVTGGRSSARMHGFVPSDVDADALTGSLGAEGLQGQVEKGALPSRDLDKLASDIVTRAN